MKVRVTYQDVFEFDIGDVPLEQFEAGLSEDSQAVDLVFSFGDINGGEAITIDGALYDINDPQTTLVSVEEVDV